MRHIHFIGIGGVGMNGLAQLAARSNYCVTGSDRGYNPDAEIYLALDKLGIQIFAQDGSGIRLDTDQVVYSTAIESDNPDLARAEELEIPLLHRAEFLKELVGAGQLIAVAGTAGKTTTTGLLGWIFECLGKDPSVYNGAAVLNWKTDTSPGNVRKGRSNLWIIEADESDKSFLKFNPTHSIITNISRDHYELDELRNMFNQFEFQTSGITVRGWSDTSAAPDLRVDPSGVRMLGRHNLENAACAARLCHELGMDMERVQDAISRFKGIERRLQVVGEIAGVTIIDDYAHNPAKIAAALSAVREAFHVVHAYWRPHGFTPLYQCEDELRDVFRQIRPTSLFILPVYYAGGTVERKTTSARFVDKLNSTGIPVKLVPDYPALQHELELCATRGDAVLGMGARDPELPLFAKKLVVEWKTPRP